MIAKVYEPIERCGEGVFGQVVKAKDKETQEIVAIKRQRKAELYRSREEFILSMVKGFPNCIQHKQTFFSADAQNKMVMNFVFEYVDSSLEKLIQSSKRAKIPIPMKLVKSIFKQLLTGINCIHSKEIAHRDIKPDNILLSKNYEVKIADFGSAKIIKQDSLCKENIPRIIARSYRPPELLIGKQDYSNKVDIWSIGCVLYEMLSLTQALEGKNDGMMLFEIIPFIGTPNDSEFEAITASLDSGFKADLSKYIGHRSYLRPDYSNYFHSSYKDKDKKDGADLISKMLVWDYRNRISAEAALSHPFITDQDAHKEYK